MRKEGVFVLLFLIVLFASLSFVMGALDVGVGKGEPVGGASLYDYETTISSSQNNVNLHDLVVAGGWDGGSVVSVLCTIDSGVLIGSTSASIPAFDVGVFPAGSIIEIVNNGEIIGAGGKGGDGGFDCVAWFYCIGEEGEKGGIAVKSNINTIIDNQGTIAGGGGGGAAADSKFMDSYADFWTEGGAGGGGQGSTGGAVGLALLSGDESGNSGTAGTLSSSGIGGAAFCHQYTHQHGWGAQYAGKGGDGGALGQAGGSGKTAWSENYVNQLFNDPIFTTDPLVGGESCDDVDFINTRTSSASQGGAAGEAVNVGSNCMDWIDQGNLIGPVVEGADCAASHICSSSDQIIMRLESGTVSQGWVVDHADINTPIINLNYTQGSSSFLILDLDDSYDYTGEISIFNSRVRGEGASVNDNDLTTGLKFGYNNHETKVAVGFEVIYNFATPISFDNISYFRWYRTGGTGSDIEIHGEDVFLTDAAGTSLVYHRHDRSSVISSTKGRGWNLIEGPFNEVSQIVFDFNASVNGGGSSDRATTIAINETDFLELVSCLPGDDCVSPPRGSLGAVWDYSGGGYDYEVCYRDIFGVDYVVGVGEDVHDGGTVLWLNDTGNAFASTSIGGDYDVAVKYGDLQCVARSGSCSAGEEVVVSLSDTTDALISAGDDPAYDTKICCKPSPAVVGGAYWADMNGNALAPAETDKGDDVKLVLEDSGLNVGDKVNFTIEELSFIDEWVYDSDNPLEGEVNSNGDAIAIWTITQADYDKTTQHERYVFHVLGEDSNELLVLEDGEDTPMTLNIKEPVCGEDMMKGTIRNITIEAFDEDDLIQGNLTVSGVKLGEFENGVFNFVYTFDNPGNIHIVATGFNTGGEQRGVVSNVMIIDDLIEEDYTASCIDNPVNFESIRASSVHFIANSSRAVIYHVSNQTLVNLTTDTDRSALNFYWVFSDGRDNPDHISGSDILSHDFWKEFIAAGDNWANLEVRIASDDVGGGS